jgi:hypothetical protein
MDEDMDRNEPAAAGTEPLTLDSALGLLSADDEREEIQGGPAKSPEAHRSSDETTCASCEDSSSAREADAPASWKTEERELFRALPPPLQARIAARERERERAVNEALREAATHRKSAESGRRAQESERLAYEQQLGGLVQGMQHQLAADFADLRTPGDLVALAQKDPARYAVLRARQDALQHAQSQHHQIQAQMAEQHKAQLETYAQGEKAALIEKRPDLKDKATRERFARDLKDYAVSVGYAPEQFDGNLSHVNLLVLEKAMLYDRAKRARAEAEVRPVPRVQQPGTAASRGDRAADNRMTKLKRLERSGRIEDAIGLLRN